MFEKGQALFKRETKPTRRNQIQHWRDVSCLVWAPTTSATTTWTYYTARVIEKGWTLCKRKAKPTRRKKPQHWRDVPCLVWTPITSAHTPWTYLILNKHDKIRVLERVGYSSSEKRKQHGERKTTIDATFRASFEHQLLRPTPREIVQNTSVWKGPGTLQARNETNTATSNSTLTWRFVPRLSINYVNQQHANFFENTCVWKGPTLFKR